MGFSLKSRRVEHAGNVMWGFDYEEEERKRVVLEREREREIVQWNKMSETELCCGEKIWKMKMANIKRRRRIETRDQSLTIIACVFYFMCVAKAAKKKLSS